MILTRKQQPLSTDSQIQHYIQQLYLHQHQHITRRNNIAETSGEILLPGINKIVASINITQDDHFMDLGSGTGKVVLHVFMRTKVGAASGIEIVANQFERSIDVAARVRNEVPAMFLHGRSLNYIHGDFLVQPFRHATILLIASPCFTPSMLDKIAGVINLTPSIHTVISLRPLIKLNRLTCERVFNVECSWDSSLCYLYRTP